MSRDFQMQFRHSEGNLHIRTSGKLDVDAARELLKLFVSEYRHGGRIFVDTAGLEDIHPAVRGLLDSGLPESSVAPSSLYFKGEKGFQIAPAGCRVIVMARDGKEKRKTGTPRGRRFSRHVCCGKCAHCTCHGQGHGEGGIVIEKVPSPCMEEAEQARAIVKEKRSFSEQVFPERGCGFPFRIT